MIHLNKAIINIRTTQVDINTKQDEVIELITEGKFYKKSDAYYLVYDESEISGMQGTTTTLKIKDMTMEMLTKSVDVYIKEEPLEIDITIEYDILIKNMFEGRNSMHITVNK